MYVPWPVFLRGLPEPLQAAALLRVKRFPASTHNKVDASISIDIAGSYAHIVRRRHPLQQHPSTPTGISISDYSLFISDHEVFLTISIQINGKNGVTNAEPSVDFLHSKNRTKTSGLSVRQ